MGKMKYVLFEPGGRQVRGYESGQLTEVRYIDVVRTDIESADREEFLSMIKDLDCEFLKRCRVGYVDEHGVGRYCDPLDFINAKDEID